jgi:hypothetical protein
MPDRVIREELLESDPYLGLKDNADRLCFLSCMLRCDTLGNLPASPTRLLRMWRDWGVATEQLVAKSLTELVEAKLVLLYEFDGKRYLHIPKFRQNRRYLGRLWPLSPFNTDAEHQRVAKLRPDHPGLWISRPPPTKSATSAARRKLSTGKSQATSSKKQPVAKKSHAVHGEPPLGVGVGVGLSVGFHANDGRASAERPIPGIDIPEGQKQTLTQEENRQRAAALVAAVLKPVPPK